MDRSTLLATLSMRAQQCGLSGEEADFNHRIPADIRIFNLPLSAGARADLAKQSISVAGDEGGDGVIAIGTAQATRPRGVRMNLFGRKGQIVCIFAPAFVCDVLNMAEDRQWLAVAPSDHAQFFPKVIIRQCGSGVAIGKDTSSNECSLRVDGTNTCISIGGDCMIAHGVEIASSDEHAIIDLLTRKQVNYPKTVVIGGHTWIGANTSIVKGVRLSPGTIVGARSLVKKGFPDHVAIGGVPARILRRDVTWSRHCVLSDADIQAMRLS